MRYYKCVNSKQLGQAMVEFIIVASFVLVPLFLMIPLIAKYTDIQHNTIQAARYEAWEYTVWNNNINDNSSNFSVTGLTEPVKTITSLRKESRQRFFSTMDSTDLSSSDQAGWNNASKNEFWDDYHQQALYDGSIEGSLSYNADTPDRSGGVINTLINLVSAVPNFIQNIPGLGNFTPGFHALSTQGLHRSTVIASVRNAPNYTDIKEQQPLFESNLNLKFSATAAVLSDGWNAGGREHAKKEAEGLVPTRLLRTPFQFIQTVSQVLFFIPPEELGNLEWGHTDSEAIPPEYMSDYDANTNATECSNDGFCGY